MPLPLDWKPPRLIPISAKSNAGTNYWTANILNTTSWAMKAHAFTNSLGTFTVGGTNLCGSANVSLVTPDVLCAAYSDTDFDSIDICLYSVDTVLATGSAYSAGAAGISTAIKHTPYATASLPKSTAVFLNTNHYIVPWDSSRFLVVYRHEGATATRRIFVVSVVDGSFDEITPSFSAAGWAVIAGTNDCHPFRSSDGYLVTTNGDTSDLRIYKHEIDGTQAYVSPAFTGSPTGLLGLVELDDGSIVTCISYSGSIGAYKLSADLSTATALTGDPATVTHWTRTIPFGRAGSFATGYNVPKKWTLSGTVISNSDFIPTTGLADDGGSQIHWTFQYDRYYSVSRYILDSTVKKVGAQNSSTAAAHPTLAVLNEMEAAIPVGDTSLFNIVAPKISYDPSLAFAASSGYMEPSYGVNLVGIVDEEGATRPLMRTTRLVVSNTSSLLPYMEFDGDRVPTVANIIAGSNMSVTTSGSNVTISTNAADATGGIAGAYDIERGGAPTYTDEGLSEEFEDGTINSNWTVVVGGGGTVNPLSTVTTPVYDLTTRDKGMLIQTGNTAWNASPSGYFQMRAAVIGDGDELMVSLSVPMTPTTTLAAYQPRLAISETTTIFSGTRTEMYFSQSGTGDSRDLIFYNGSQNTRQKHVAPIGGRCYFRVVRSGTTYHMFYSSDGTSWNPVGAHSNTTAGYIWIMMGTVATWTRLSPATGDPIGCINWIRHVPYVGLDPW